MLSIRIGLVIVACLGAALWMLTPGASADDVKTRKAKDFIDAFTKKVRPLDIAANRAWWDAMITGKAEAFKQKEDAQNKLDALPGRQDAVRGTHRDPRRQRDRRSRRQTGHRRHLPAYLEKQLDAELLKEMTKTVQRDRTDVHQFPRPGSRRQGRIGAADAEVRKILKTSTMSERRQEVWEAAKELGKVVEPGLKKLVKLRNEAAKKLGFDNFHAMQLYPQRTERRAI